MSKKPVVLMILDGYGLNDKKEGNAVAEAKTPVMDKLMAEYPFVKGNASGMAVGLPDGQMGNSEVGHLNMGAGRIVYQELTRITKEIQDGTFFENPTEVSTATLLIFTAYWNWQSGMALRRYMYIASWMAVIRLRPAARDMWSSWKRK